MSFTILGTGSALPARSVTNDELSEFLDTSDEWIRERTGIASRPLCTTECLDDLAMLAAQRALEDAQMQPGQLDAIICTTCSAERATPALACVLQQKLGATCPAFDINAACAGFVFALDVVDGMFARNRASRVLVVSAEKMSRLVDWTDRATCVLFSDGAGAAVLGAGGESPLYLNLTCDGDCEAIHAFAPAGNSPFDQTGAQIVAEEGVFVHMRGREVFKFAVTHIVSELNALSQATGVPLGEIDHFVFHQANRRIIDAGVERLGLDPSRVAITIDHTANSSSACIPITLDTLNRQGKLLPGQLVAIFGFGSGLVTGSCLLRWGV